MTVQLIDSKGVSVKSYLLQKPAIGSIQSYLSAGTIPSGNYTLQVKVGSFSESTAVVKQ
jgi:hypothetical protein